MNIKSLRRKPVKNNITIQFPFLSILFLIFLTLKLTGHITWSWWWVTAPLWGGLVVVCILLGVVFLAAFITLLLDEYIRK